ncbi:MAG: peptidase domain-containing ABC transporter [Candidatus Saccharibacteria bacterium]|nr:peptidase domain-containing ABC transporter [Pseudorhodobacter sp.]
MTISDPKLALEMALRERQLTAIRAAFLIAAHHGQSLRPEDLPKLTDGDMLAPVTVSLARVGLRCRLLQRCTVKTAATLGTAYPALIPCKDGSWIILITVMQQDGAQVAAILDPAHEAAGVQMLGLPAFAARWSGQILLVQKTPTLQAETAAFGLSWFVPAVRSQARLLAGVALAVVVGNLISFSLPLLFQVLIDRVIAHQAWNTLTAIVVIYVVLASFDAGFSYVRQRLMQIAGARVDAIIGARTFAHLLSLPLSVFETTPAGVLTRHMQQTEKIRAFLTGRLFQTLLDAAFLPLLLGILMMLSGALTAVVLGFALAIAGCIGLLLPTFRRRLNALYAAEGERQANLTETLHNMRAVKSLVLEPLRRRIWEDNLAAALRRQRDVGAIGAIAGSATGFLEKLMQISIIAYGAALVLEAELSTGALVAFVMLAGRVTGPLVQIVGLINEYQEAALSVRMLAGVMNQKREGGEHPRPMRHQISGWLKLEQVSFTYPGAAVPALAGVSLDIVPGQVIGVVGRSGSGKTTLTRLIQGIEVPQAGLIQVDGVDIRQIDLEHLRRSLGVVLQENLLFRGTIRDNIATARPDAGLEEVLIAAKLAGAEEFIRRLPQGFDTKVEEGGANLSGGQRQRIAIARALMASPRILVFDEATSALDPESEAVVNRNLSAIAKGRTVIIVSHRLSSLVRADAIVVLEQGHVVDMAPHAVLLDRCDIYRHLWQQQTEHLT